MKTSFCKILSLVASIVLITVTLPTYGISVFATDATDIYTETDDGNTSRIYAVGDGTYGLELYLNKSYDALDDNYYFATSTNPNWQNVCQDKTQLEGRIRSLLIGAVEIYNQNHPDAMLKVSPMGTAPAYDDINYSITEITVSANPTQLVSSSLWNRVLPSEGFKNVKKLNLSDMTVFNSWKITNKTRPHASFDVFGNMNLNPANSLIKQFDNSGQLIEYSNLYECLYPELTTLILPNTITKISVHALRNLKNLTEITIPDTVQVIGRRNFDGATNLKTITLPDSLTSFESDNNKDYDIVLEKFDGFTWNYHGKNLIEDHHKYLVSSINNTNPVSLDFSNSCINMTDLESITKTNLTYINIKNSDIESAQQGTTEYENLVTYLKGLQENNITVDTNINLSTVTETYSDNEMNTSKLTKLEDGTYSWELHFEKSYHAYDDPNYYTGDAIYSENVCTDMNRLGGRVRNLLIGAVDNYNQLNNSNLSVSELGTAANYGDINYQITELKVTSNAQKYISMSLFNRILPSDGFVNLKKIDMSGMNVVNSFDAANRTGAETVCNVLGNMNFNLSRGTMYYKNSNNQTVAYESSFGCIYPVLETLILPSTLTKVDNQALRNLPSLTEIVIPDSVTSIGRFNFNQDIALKSITLPASLVSIHSDALNNNFLVGANHISGVTWNYHGQSLDSDTHEYLVNSINNSAPGGLDFSNSCVSATDILEMNTATVNYLNIKGSAVESVEVGTKEYFDLVTLVESLRSKGAVVETNLEFLILGDVNQDNALTVKDLVRLKKNLAAMSEDLINDINQDGVVDASDLIRLRNMLLATTN